MRLNSSAISEVEYNPASRHLKIRFKDSKWYDFVGVPESIYQGLISASSAGTYYHNHIEGRYQS
ncbi:KTSC domain-containing protein [Roseibacillus persicicus]|uniref:KTSC domain-containing protein n=1 Tax=Roseibacillus persicicus TaxID=454148 RepID=UPI00398B1D14